MSNTDFTFDADAGYKHVDTVDEIVESMRHTLKMITEKVGESQSIWKGSAAGAFVNVSDAWGGEATRLNAALDTLKAALSGEVFSKSSEADADIEADFAKVNGALNLP